MYGYFMYGDTMSQKIVLVVQILSSRWVTVDFPLVHVCVVAVWCEYQIILRKSKIWSLESDNYDPTHSRKKVYY